MILSALKGFARFCASGGAALPAFSGKLDRAWQRPAAVEFRTLGWLALPIIVTQLSQMAMSTMDVIMAGRLGATDLAGVTLGTNLYFPTMLLLSGTIMSVTPAVSQLHGAGRLAEAGAVVRQALWLAVAGGSAVAFALNNVEPVYRWLQVDERAIPVAVAYLNALSLGLVPLLAYASLRCLCEGMSWTRPAMVISLSALPLKLLLNWLFIYGAPSLGIPAMGGPGCGWATALVMVYMLTMMVGVVLFSRIRAANTFAVFSWPNVAEIAHLLKIGLPIGFALFVEVAFFSLVTLLIGRLGVATIASHQVALNIAGAAFMVPLALGMAATIRVGFNVGAENLAGARRAAWVAIGTTVTWGCLLATLMLTLRHHIVGLYSTEPDVISVAASLLVLAAMFQVFDASQATMMGALRGYKDTRVPMFIALFAYWIVGLPVGYALCYGVDAGAGATFARIGVDSTTVVFSPSQVLGGVTVERMGIHGFWWGLVVSLAIAAIALGTRLARVSRIER